MMIIQELQLVLEKLVKFIGKSVRNVVERGDEKYCFRLHKNRVYYVREQLVKKATNVCFFIHVALLLHVLKRAQHREAGLEQFRCPSLVARRLPSIPLTCCPTHGYRRSRRHRRIIW